MPKQQLARVTASLDCGLMVLDDIPAFYNGTSPNKFFDYISSGIPVVTNYKGWIAELCEYHKCGTAAGPAGTASMAAALIAFQRSPELAKEMGENARKLAVSQFSRSSQAEQFADVIEKAVSI
jgi:glycosyltransferase involved in cell wall biosynthesis